MKIAYFEHFQCLAADCPDDCCHGWNIELDQSTLTSWQSLADENFRDELMAGVVEEGSTEEKIIRKRQDGRCVHLQDDGLCRVQGRLGHEFLPQTCQEYPRVIVEGRTGQLISLHLSCPAVVYWLISEAGRKVLFFGEENTCYTNPKDENGDLEFNDLCTVLSGFVREVMNVRTYPLGMRLYVIASVISEVTRLAAREELDWNRLLRITPITEEKLQKFLQTVSKKYRKGKIQAERGDIAKFWYFVFTCGDGLTADIERISQARETRLARHWRMMRYEDVSDMRRLEALVHEAQSISGKLRKRVDDILSDYLKVKFANHGFPWYPFKNHFVATFLDAVVPYFQIRTLIGMYLEASGSLNDEVIAEIIYSVEKRLSHNLKIFDAVGQNPWVLELDRFSAGWIGDGQ